MRLSFIDILTTQLVVVPLLLLLALSFFAIHSCRRFSLLPSGVRVSSDHATVYSFGHCLSMISPFLLTFFLNFSAIRGFEGGYFMSQMSVSAWHLKFFFFGFLLFVLGLILFSNSSISSTSPYVFEIVVALVWLFWSFFWIMSISGLVTFLFF